MKIRWTGGQLICGGRLRENGEVYDDFVEHSCRDLIGRGLAVLVEEPPSDPIPEPVKPSKKPLFSEEKE